MARRPPIVVVLVIAAITGLAAAGGRASVADAPFADLFTEYRSGNADAAVAAFAQWKPERVAAEARLGPAAADLKAQAALAVLHTEAGMRSHTFGVFLPDTPRELFLGFWGLENVFEIHSLSAYRLVADLSKRARAENNDALRHFCRRWYILTVSYCMRWGRQCGEQLVERGEHDLDGDEDPEFLLLLGSRDEGWRRHDDGEPKGPAMGQYARWSLKKALELRPDLAEARMRLGRLYHMAGEDEDALRELTQALTDARATGHLFATHMAALTLGELHEEQDRLDTAIEYYRAAVASYPRGHTAAIALGQALVRSDRAAEGWSIAREMFATEGATQEAALDPYSIHRAAQYWQSAASLAALRTTVRQ